MAARVSMRTRRARTQSTARSHGLSAAHAHRDTHHGRSHQSPSPLSSLPSRRSAPEVCPSGRLDGARDDGTGASRSPTSMGRRAWRAASTTANGTTARAHREKRSGTRTGTFAAATGSPSGWTSSSSSKAAKSRSAGTWSTSHRAPSRCAPHVLSGSDARQSNRWSPVIALSFLPSFHEKKKIGWACGGRLFFFRSLVLVGAGAQPECKRDPPTVCGGRVVNPNGRSTGRDTKRHSTQTEEKKYFFRDLRLVVRNEEPPIGPRRQDPRPTTLKRDTRNGPTA